MQQTVLVYEDDLHEMVLKKIFEYLGLDTSFFNWSIKHGKSYIDSRIKDYARVSGTRIIVMRDLDNDATCAPELLAKLLRGVRPSADFIFRIAVTEAEAWLVADKANAIDFLNYSPILYQA